MSDSVTGCMGGKFGDRWPNSSPLNLGPSEWLLLPLACHVAVTEVAQI